MKLKKNIAAPSEIYHQISEGLIKSIQRKPQSILGLATGRTFLPIYEILVALSRKSMAQKELTYQEVTTFNLDEYIGIPQNDPKSFYTYMHINLFSKLDFNSKSTFLPYAALASQAQSEANRFESLIREKGGVDIQLLGLGLNGHIGFNEPGSRFDSLTRVVELTQTTREQNKPMFASREVPTHAITMGLATIMRAKKIVLLVIGEEKHDILEKCMMGPNENYPASVLLSHPQCELWTDLKV